MALQVVLDPTTGELVTDYRTGELVTIEVANMPLVLQYNIENGTTSGSGDATGFNQIDTFAIGVVTPNNNSGNTLDADNVIVSGITFNVTEVGVAGSSGSGISSFPVQGGVTDPYDAPYLTQRFIFTNSSSVVRMNVQGLDSGTYEVQMYFIGANNIDRIADYGVFTTDTPIASKTVTGALNGLDYSSDVNVRLFTTTVVVTDGRIDLQIAKNAGSAVSGMNWFSITEIVTGVALTSPLTRSLTGPLTSNLTG